MDELEEILAEIDALLARRNEAIARGARRPVARRRRGAPPSDGLAPILPLRRRAR